MKDNIMKTIKLGKVTLNIGAGANQDDVEKAFKLLSALSGEKPVKTFAKKRIATWKIRPGLPIGAKVTLRGKKAQELLARLLNAVNNEIKSSSFTENGFSFGIREYIDIPDAKYDPSIGIIGLDVIVSLERPGFRIKRRKLKQSTISPTHRIYKEDSIAYIQKVFGVKLK
jgi:large subunit ribosomal protein L5